MELRCRGPCHEQREPGPLSGGWSRMGCGDPRGTSACPGLAQGCPGAPPRSPAALNWGLSGPSTSQSGWPQHLHMCLGPPRVPLHSLLLPRASLLTQPWPRPQAVADAAGGCRTVWSCVYF